MIESLSKAKKFSETLFLCTSICGRTLLPISQKENDEVFSILGRIGVSSLYAWLRISDVGTEGIWRDIENDALVNFTNWYTGHPSGSKSNYDYASMNTYGKWYAHPEESYTRSTIICELP